MDSLILILMAGFLGGAIRGVVGLIKYSTSYKDVEIRPWYFSGMVGLSGLIGLLAAYVTADLGITFLGLEKISFSIALILGYAGGDILENLYKIILQKSTIY